MVLFLPQAALVIDAVHILFQHAGIIGMNQAANGQFCGCTIKVIGQGITVPAAGIAEFECIGSQIPLEKDNIIC
jgi:hypothetical protein